MCICVDVYKIYEWKDFQRIFEALSASKQKKNNILIEKYKDMLGNPDFDQANYSRTAICIYKIGQDCIRLMKWLVYYDRSIYESINYYDMMGSILKSLKEIS